MLGWSINIYRQDTSYYGRSEADYIGNWIVGPGGTDWLDELVKAGDAMMLLNNGGYPLRYAVRVSDLLVHLSGEPNVHRGPSVIGEDYYMPKGWKGPMSVNSSKLTALKPHEVVIIDAWDQS